jgi:hypothetical protein
VPSLYSTGWRQGSMFDYTLALNSVVLEAEHGIVDHPAVHDSWVVASQDCTLDQNDIAVSEPILELRPIWTNNPPTDWGIRARKFLLSRSQYVDDYSPRTSIAPAALHYIKAQGIPATPLAPDRALAFKTWLGYRYDRPAVPPDRLELAQEIAGQIRVLRQPAVPVVRDVLMQFSLGDPPEYGLVAVVLDPADKPLVRKWLADVALQVPSHLGTASRLEAVTTREASLDLLENSYAADVTQITWRRTGPQGAH